MTKEEIVEKFARAWASMDGKLEEFEKGKADPAYDMEVGHYMGYMTEAEELIKRSGMAAHLKVVSKFLEHQYAEKNGQYFICGEGGEKNETQLPKYVYICPTFGLDWFQVYERTDRTVGPEW